MKKIILVTVGLLIAIAAGGAIWMASRLSPDVEAGDALPEIALTDLEGKRVDLAATHAGKLVLLDFWSST